MTFFKELKSSYQKKNTQFILIDSEKTVIESDNVLVTITQNKSITEIHPFFFSIDPLTHQNYTCVHLDLNTKTIICDVEVKPIKDGKCLIILSDFSKHYESFQSLAQLRNETAINSEITQLNNELLLKKEEFKNKFIANFSHEIISPIMSILTFNNILKKTKLTNEQKDYTDVINTSTYHLKSMVNDVLDLTKIETNNIEIINKRFSLRKLIRAIDTEYKLKCKQKGLAFKIEYDSDMPTYIVSDKTRIFQVLKNLIDNAIKFTDSGSISITIKKIYKRARDLTFSVIIKDTGRGIKQEEQDLVFNRFTRLENSHNTIGAGLGLTITKELVNLLNGHIEIESKADAGTAFITTFRTKTPLTEINPRKNKNLNTISKANIKVLLVEDNLTDQLSIFKILANNKNYFLDIASNGFDAIELIKTNTYDIILMDYGIPKIDGLKTAKSIKKINKNLPIVIITGRYIDENLKNGKGSYFKNILKKPFDEETLINSINMCLK